MTTRIKNFRAAADKATSQAFYETVMTTIVATVDTTVAYMFLRFGIIHVYGMGCQI